MVPKKVVSSTEAIIGLWAGHLLQSSVQAAGMGVGPKTLEIERHIDNPALLDSNLAAKLG